MTREGVLLVFLLGIEIGLSLSFAIFTRRSPDNKNQRNDP